MNIHKTDGSVYFREQLWWLEYGRKSNNGNDFNDSICFPYIDILSIQFLLMPRFTKELCYNNSEPEGEHLKGEKLFSVLQQPQGNAFLKIVL